MQFLKLSSAKQPMASGFAPTSGRPRSVWAKKGWRRTMKLLRRIHLYAGLALVPFVALYGVTGFLFNHPEIWSETQDRRFSAEELDAAGRQLLGPPDAFAQQVMASVQQAGWSLDPHAAARWRGRTFLAGESDSHRYSFLVDDADGSARAYVRPPRSQAAQDAIDLAEDESLDVGKVQVESLEAAADALLGEEAASDDGSTVRWRLRDAPRLEFGMLRDGEAHRAVYDLQDGSLELAPADEPRQARSLRSFLLRLHTAHGYPANRGAGYWWAWIVDIMSVAMVTWAGTGLLMWWQMKNVRRLGLAALAVCAVATTVLVAGQWGRLG